MDSKNQLPGGSGLNIKSSKSKSKTASSTGGEVGDDEAAEDSDSSSSSSSSSTKTLTPMSGSPADKSFDELEEFREKWRKEVEKSKKKVSERKNDDPVAKADENVEDEKKQEQSDFFRAKGLFLEGVELEQRGEHFQAILKYKKAVQLVPDIEFRTFDYNRRKMEVNKNTEAYEKNANEAQEDSNGNEIVNEETPDEDLRNLTARFSASLSLENNKICEPMTDMRETHISDLPMELIILILKWVVSKDLDLRSLERFSQVCRGFFLAARSSDLWRLVCLNTWGINNLPLNPPCWRSYFLSRPRVLMNGCYISIMSYAREGERQFQDNEFYLPWHMVKYFRYLRFFSGGRVTMLTSAEQPSVGVKLLNTKFGINIQGAMHGHYRVSTNDHVVCVLKKIKQQVEKKRIRPVRRGRFQEVVYEVPDQEFHIELQVKGKRFRQLKWIKYTVVNIYKNGNSTSSEIDISNTFTFPILNFSPVNSFVNYSETPLC